MLLLIGRVRRDCTCSEQRSRSGIPPHEPQMDRLLRNIGFLNDPKAQPLVERDIPRNLGFEVAGVNFPIGTGKDRTKKGRSDPLALTGRIDAERPEVPVGDAASGRIRVEKALL